MHKQMRRYRLSLLPLVAILVLIALHIGGWGSRAAGQDQPAQPRPDAPGRSITVYLRGDAVGQHLNYVPSVNNMPRVQGELVSVDQDWVILRKEGARKQIARSAVLMMVSEAQ